jgi:prepilin-type N-terminal cleavage/methylation domain-containing protein
MITRRGFTLIELMIVVAIIGILAAIATPKFAELVTRSREGRTKNHLAALRSGLAVYYSDNQIYPADPSTALVDGQKYLSSIPDAEVPPVKAQNNPGHTAGATIGFAIDDGSTGNWAYLVRTDQDIQMVVNCTHTDTRGVIWSSQ